eukprot:188482-Amphidinium_carterae.1
MERNTHVLQTLSQFTHVDCVTVHYRSRMNLQTLDLIWVGGWFSRTDRGEAVLRSVSEFMQHPHVRL